MFKLEFNTVNEEVVGRHKLIITVNNNQAYVNNIAAEAHFDIEVVDSIGAREAYQDIAFLFDRLYGGKWIMMEGSRVSSSIGFKCVGGLVVDIIDDNGNTTNKKGLMAITQSGCLQDKLGQWDSFGRSVALIPFAKMSQYNIQTYYFRDGGQWFSCDYKKFWKSDVTWGQNHQRTSAITIDFNVEMSQMVVVNGHQDQYLQKCWQYIKSKQPKTKYQRKSTMAKRQYDDAEEKAIEQLIYSAKSKGCVECGVKSREVQQHHIIPKSKVFEIGEWKKLGKSVDEVREELAKCECRCPSCHTKQHLVIKNKARKDID